MFVWIMASGFKFARNAPPRNTDSNSTNDVPNPPDSSSTNHVPNPVDEISCLVDILLQKLQSNTDLLQTGLVQNKLTSLLNYIGREIISLAMTSDVLQCKYQNAKDLIELDSAKFIQNCNPMLVSFLSSVIGKRYDSMNTLQLYTFSVCIESVYHVRNRNLVLPHSFLANLIQRITSGSATVATVNGKISAAASDTTYRSWFYNQG